VGVHSTDKEYSIIFIYVFRGGVKRRVKLGLYGTCQIRIKGTNGHNYIVIYERRSVSIYLKNISWQITFISSGQTETRGKLCIP
jgi:hypothetical protein